MKKQMSEMESGKGMGQPGCCCGKCGCDKSKMWIMAIAGLALLIGGLGIVPFSGFVAWGANASWFNFWTLAGAFLLVKNLVKMSKGM